MDVGNLEHFLFADNDGSHFADMVVDSMYSWHVGDKHEEWAGFEVKSEQSARSVSSTTIAAGW